MRYIRTITLLVVLSLIAGCLHRLTMERPVACASCVQPPFSSSQAWSCYKSYLLQISDGALYTQAQLQEAVGFFERLTGISSGLIGSWGGIVMNRAELGCAIQRWDEWYSVHHDSIRWDPESEEFTSSQQTAL